MSSPQMRGFRGLIIVNRAADVQINADGTVEAESGANLSTLARRCIKQGVGGLEWAVSVPGTLGVGRYLTMPGRMAVIWQPVYVR